MKSEQSGCLGGKEVETIPFAEHSAENRRRVCLTQKRMLLDVATWQ